jgi:hypothetical protein
MRLRQLLDEGIGTKAFQFLTKSTKVGDELAALQAAHTAAKAKQILGVTRPKNTHILKPQTPKPTATQPYAYDEFGEPLRRIDVPKTSNEQKAYQDFLDSINGDKVLPQRTSIHRSNQTGEVIDDMATAIVKKGEHVKTSKYLNHPDRLETPTPKPNLTSAEEEKFRKMIYNRQRGVKHNDTVKNKSTMTTVTPGNPGPQATITNPVPADVAARVKTYDPNWGAGGQAKPLHLGPNSRRNHPTGQGMDNTFGGPDIDYGRSGQTISKKLDDMGIPRSDRGAGEAAPRVAPDAGTGKKLKKFSGSAADRYLRKATGHNTDLVNHINKNGLHNADLRVDAGYGGMSNRMSDAFNTNMEKHLDDMLVPRVNQIDFFNSLPYDKKIDIVNNVMQRIIKLGWLQ